MFRPFFAFLLLISCCSITSAAEVDTVVIHSTSMKKDIRCVVIRPSASKDKNTRLPVIYLLHGWSGKYSNWIMRVPSLKKHADDYRLMIVCPDGDYSSWYVDSPVDPSMKYETHIAKEVPEYIDAHYPTIKDRRGRAITGLSMGGHGALLLGMRHASFFGACGSMSGAVDLLSITNKYELMQRLGDTLKYAGNWKQSSIITAIDHYPNDSIAVIIDCGTEDFFYPVNRNLHEKMLTLKIPHDYIERPGKHDWAYWSNAVLYQVVYFRNFFDKMNR